MPTAPETPSVESTSPTSSDSILVTGDVVRDIYVYRGDRVYAAQKGKIAPHFTDDVGGAYSLFQLIQEVAPANTLWGLPEKKKLPFKQLQTVHVLWTPCDGDTKEEQENADKRHKPEKVWRVDQPLGYALGIARPATLARSVESTRKNKVIVIDDAGLSFRTQPSSGLWPVGIMPADELQPNWIVHKMANPITQGDLWRALIGGSKPAPRANLIVIVSAEELRRAGAAIGRGLSWENTLSDLCAQLNHNPLFQPLTRYPRRLIVNFDCVAAIWFDNSEASVKAGRPAQERATLVYDATLPEDGWKTLLADGHAVYGHLNTFTAAVAIAAAGTAIEEAGKLNEALQRGLAACRQLRLKGYGPASGKIPGPPLDELKPLLSINSANQDEATKTFKKLIPNGFGIIVGPNKNTNPADAPCWSLAALAENPLDQPHLPLYGLAHRVALYGESALQHIPHTHFGALLSVDRLETETLRGLTHLIERYKDEKRPKQPLCIAAFGPPGAGKSFGIIEICKQILGKEVPEKDLPEKVPVLVFNLSQFSQPSDLFGAFHQVRDKALKGVTPVVFWDEFDSHNYDWLQYLLAPMQDGAFQEHGHTHIIGKSIFVFAGATSWDFDHFGPAPLPKKWIAEHEISNETALESDNEEVKALAKRYKANPRLHDAEAAARTDFQCKKGPDFLSRLDAHIDVLGPNQRLEYNWETRAWTEPDAHDITSPVRRALLLRVFLGATKPSDTLSIDRDLLRAFIHVPKYCHGARSLEKIARHLALSQPPFRRANLPPPQVLAQHLDSAEAFERIHEETQRLLTPDSMDALANAINEGYNHDNPGPWNRAFNDLDAFLQQSNRAAALRIPHILALVGLRLAPRQLNQPKLNLSDPLAINTILAGAHTTEEQAVFTHIETHVEVLAEEEHRLWVQFHEENSWTFGYLEVSEPDPADPTKIITTFEKDKAKLKHPCIKPFHEMPDDHGQRNTWQDYDRNAVRRYPRLLRLTDFEIAFAKP